MEAETEVMGGQALNLKQGHDGTAGDNEADGGRNITTSLPETLEIIDYYCVSPFNCCC